MNEILLALVTFILGIFATIVTQFLNRKMQSRENKNKRKTEWLTDIQEWMISYRNLLQCKFPQLEELVLAHRYIDPNFGEIVLDGETFTLKQDKTAFENICNAMKEFKSVEKENKMKGKKAAFALRALGANSNPPNFIVLPFLYIGSVLFKKNYVYFTGALTLWYPKGIIKELAPDLSEINIQMNKLFYDFPSRVFYNIDWKLLETIQFEQFSQLLIPKHPKKNFPSLPKSRNWLESDYLTRFRDAQVYTEKEIDLLESLNQMNSCRHIAENAIDNVLLTIEKYKTEWL